MDPVAEHGQRLQACRHALIDVVRGESAALGCGMYHLEPFFDEVRAASGCLKHILELRQKDTDTRQRSRRRLSAGAPSGRFDSFKPSALTRRPDANAGRLARFLRPCERIGVR